MVFCHLYGGVFIINLVSPNTFPPLAARLNGSGCVAQNLTLVHIPSLKIMRDEICINKKTRKYSKTKCDRTNFFAYWLTQQQVS